VRLSLSSFESLSVNISRCRKSRTGKSRFSTNCGDYIVGALPATTVTDRYGKEPYSAPIVTQAPGRTEATEGINSNVDVCEKRNTTRNSSDKVV